MPVRFNFNTENWELVEGDLSRLSDDELTDYMPRVYTSLFLRYRTMCYSKDEALALIASYRKAAAVEVV